MKRRYIRLILFLFFAEVVLNTGLLKASGAVRFSAGVEINAVADFYQPLAPYGSWVNVSSYGRCWHPRVATGWRPYTAGHWEWTDVGWYWVSDDPWAWACYHYGSWVYDPSYGWIWVPATEWAPSWVIWRESPDYIGWAPCGPGGAILAPSFFVFIDIGHFHDRIRPDRVIVNNTTIINRTTVVNNFKRETRTFDGTRQTVMINQGPRLDLVQRASGTRLTPVPIRQVAQETPVPSTVKHASWRERVIQQPSRTGRDQRQVYPQETPSQGQAPRLSPRAPAAPPPQTAPVVPQRPQSQAPRPEKPVQPPTGSERGYPGREREAPPPLRGDRPRQDQPERTLPARPNAPPPESERPVEHEREKDRPGA